jgi:hypothetical protein
MTGECKYASADGEAFSVLALELCQDLAPYLDLLRLGPIREKKFHSSSLL